MPQTPRQRLEGRLEALRTERTSWMSHWQDLSELILPSRGRFLDGRDVNPGRKRRSRIFDSTAEDAVNTTVAGMSSGLTSPSARWFRLSPEDDALNEAEGVRSWLDHAEDQLYRVLRRGGFYDAMPAIYAEALVFGTAALWQDADRENGSRFQPLTIGEYMLANDETGRATTGYREFSLTVDQTVRRFGLERCSRPVREAYDKGNYESPVEIVHAIEPKGGPASAAPGGRRWAYVSVYWERGTRDSHDDQRDFLRVSGYEDCPLHATRWEQVGPSAYGYAPGQKVLPDVKQLQVAARQRAVAIDRASGNGPTQGPALINKQIDLSPGAHNEVPQGKDYSITPIFQIPPQAVAAIGESVGDLRQRIKAGLFADLFIIFAAAERRPQMTAYEASQIAAEKVLILGPTVTRFDNELLDPVLERAFGQLLRASQPMWARGEPGPLGPPPPAELADQDLRIEYEGVLQQAARAAKANAVQGVMQTVAAIRQMFPEDPGKVDKFDPDQALDEMAKAVGAPGSLLKSDDAVAKLREARAQEQAAALEAQQLQQAAETAPAVTGAMRDMAEMQGGAP